MYNFVQGIYYFVLVNTYCFVSWMIQFHSPNYVAPVEGTIISHTPPYQ